MASYTQEGGAGLALSFPVSGTADVAASPGGSRLEEGCKRIKKFGCSSGSESCSLFVARLQRCMMSTSFATPSPMSRGCLGRPRHHSHQGGLKDFRIFGGSKNGISFA